MSLDRLKPAKSDETLFPVIPDDAAMQRFLFH